MPIKKSFQKDAARLAEEILSGRTPRTAMAFWALMDALASDDQNWLLEDDVVNGVCSQVGLRPGTVHNLLRRAHLEGMLARTLMDKSRYVTITHFGANWIESKNATTFRERNTAEFESLEMAT